MTPAVPPPLKSMLAVAGQPPGGPGWAFEVKWDGVWAIVAVAVDRARLTSRNGDDVTLGCGSSATSVPGSPRPCCGTCWQGWSRCAAGTAPTTPYDKVVPAAYARRARWAQPVLVGEVVYRSVTRRRPAPVRRLAWPAPGPRAGRRAVRLMRVAGDIRFPPRSSLATVPATGSPGPVRRGRGRHAGPLSIGRRWPPDREPGAHAAPGRRSPTRPRACSGAGRDASQTRA